MTSPTPPPDNTDPYGWAPWQRESLPIANRAALLAFAVTTAFTSGAMVAFAALTGVLPNSDMITARLLGVNPTAFNVLALTLATATICAASAWWFTWTRCARLRTFNPIHWVGALNVFLAISTAAATFYFTSFVWQEYDSLLAALVAWWLVYTFIIPGTADNRWRRAMLRDESQ